MNATDVQIVLMGPFGRIDLPHVTQFTSDLLAKTSTFHLECDATLCSRMDGATGELGTFYVYSTAPNGSTDTHQFEGARLHGLKTLCSGQTFPTSWAFTFSNRRRI